jgi:hypothetical protein
MKKGVKNKTNTSKKTDTNIKEYKKNYTKNLKETIARKKKTC